MLAVHANAPSGCLGDPITPCYWDIELANVITSPKEYQLLLKGKTKISDGWQLGPVLFEGTFEYEDFNEMIESIRHHSYYVESYDEPTRLKLGFKCKSGRQWQIGLVALKRSQMKMSKKRQKWFQTCLGSAEGKKEFLTYLNTKLPWTR
jgi:hypothetical protein